MVVQAICNLGYALNLPMEYDGNIKILTGNRAVSCFPCYYNNFKEKLKQKLPSDLNTQGSLYTVNLSLQRKLKRPHYLRNWQICKGMCTLRMVKDTKGFIILSTKFISIPPLITLSLQTVLLNHLPLQTNTIV